MIRIKRVYEEPTKDDGYRMLVDRLWPRGLTKEHAKVDLWMKEMRRATHCESGLGTKRKNGWSLRSDMELSCGRRKTC